VSQCFETIRIVGKYAFTSDKSFIRQVVATELGGYLCGEDHGIEPRKKRTRSGVLINSLSVARGCNNPLCVLSFKSRSEASSQAIL
jgi:hypothetical protein